MQAEGDIEWLKNVMLAVRNIRAEMNIGPGKAIPLYLSNSSSEDRRRLNVNETTLAKLARLESISVLGAGQEPPMSATALVGDMQVLVPMAGLIDTKAELARLDKEIKRLEGEIKRVSGKLSNQGFVAKAPAAVIEKERAKQTEYEHALEQLTEQRAKMASL